MKTILRTMLAWKHIAITATAVVSITSTAKAVINIEFVYDAIAGETTASYFGTLNAAPGVGPQNLGTIGSLTQTAFYSIPGDFMSAPVTLVATGDAWVSGSLVASSVNGEAFGFDAANIYAPVGYVASGSISGFLVLPTDLAGLGLNVGDAGSFSGGGETINWSVVPEPSSVALLLGAFVLSVALLRRRMG